MGRDTERFFDRRHTALIGFEWSSVNSAKTPSDLTVQQLVTELAIERLVVAVLPNQRLPTA
jgi:hypothetical protein